MVDKEQGDSGVKRRLLVEPLPSDLDNEKVLEHQENIPMITDGVIQAKEMVVPTTKKDRSKRPKKTGADSSSLGSVGSQEESVRSQ